MQQTRKSLKRREKRKKERAKKKEHKRKSQKERSKKKKERRKKGGKAMPVQQQEGVGNRSANSRKFDLRYNRKRKQGSKCKERRRNDDDIV